MDKRLARIKVMVNGTLLRQYVLTYESGESTGKSRIAAIREHGFPGTAFPPATFSWTGASDEFNTEIWEEESASFGTQQF